MARKATQVTLGNAFKQMLQDQGLATQKDIDKLCKKIDRLEVLLKKSVSAKGTPKTASPKAKGDRKSSATSVVLEAIKKSRSGADMNYIQSKTGYDEKKLRNIVFRLNNLGKIKRVGRGKYVGA